METLTIKSKIRGGGSVGANAWIARILGADAKWHLKRKFVRYDTDTSGSGKSGVIRFYIEHPGIYQLNGVGDFTGGSIRYQEMAGGGFCGFIRVSADGSYEIISKGFKKNYTDILALLEIDVNPVMKGENPYEFRD